MNCNNSTVYTLHACKVGFNGSRQSIVALESSDEKNAKILIPPKVSMP